jgi:PAS domain S-box-containing protein
VDFLARLFDTSDFPARWQCGNWTAGHGWLHILSDLGVWSAYVAIPCVLGYFVIRKKDIPFRTIFLLFGAFILACGTTHLMEALIFWWPAYRLAGVIKLVTAIVSWGTVLALVPVAPKALAMRSPEELEREIAARKEAENALQTVNTELEARVRGRTAELAEANASLRYEREMLRITLASIGDAVMATDLKGRVTFLNSVAQTLTGWKEEDARGQPLEGVFRIVNEKTRKMVVNPALRALKEGTIVGLANHTILIARDGTERAIDDSAAPIRHEDGTVAGAVLVFRDVTEQRKAERSARFLASIVESSDDAIIGKDVNGIITSWNRGAERLFGYTAAEAVGRPVAMLAPPDRADEMPDILRRIRRGERVDHFDTVRRARDGRLVPISLTVSPIKDEDGEIVGASKIARDISERKRAEEALREEKERLHATLTGIGDAVIVTDARSVVTLMNPVAQNLTGWGNEATGRPLEEVFRIVNGQTRRPAESPVGRVLREGTFVGLANHTALVARDGTERPIEDSAAPVRGEGGEVVGVVLVFRDATERRAAEAAAQRHEQVLKLVHQIGKIGHWEWNSLTDENKWSPEIEALYGLPPGGFEGGYEGWTKLLHPDDLPRAEEDVRRALQTGKYFTEFRVIWPDGNVHWLEARANVFTDGHDKPVRIMGVNMDVTERKQAEELLRQSERRLAAELEAMSRLHALSTRLLLATDLGTALEDVLENAVLTCGADFGNVQLYNPKSGALEITAQRGVGQDFLDYFRLVRVDDDSACARAMRDGERIIIEDVELDPAYELHRPIAAAAGYRAVQSTPIKSRGGSVLGMLSTHFRTPHRPSERDERLLDLYARSAADLIERKRAEQAVRSATQQLQTVTESLSITVARCSRDFKYLWVNKACAEFLGLPSEEIVGRPIIEILGPSVFEQLRPHFEKVLRGERTSYEREADCGGIGPRWIHAVHSPTFDAEGKPDGWVAVSFDITDRKKMEESLRSSEQLLHEADRRKDEFLATLAHELRNPLAPIRNAVYILNMKRSEGDELQNARDIIDRQVRQMSRLVDDLLDVSRIGRGKINLQKERAGLSPILTGAVEASRPLIEANRHELALALPLEPVYVHADTTRLTQVFSNLLNNAAKYTEPGGRIGLTAERQGSDVVVTVKDNGTGIPADRLPALFAMYSQVEGSLSRSQGGLGIGLHLVKRLVEMHGGSVAAHSDGPGKGSEFVVRLPVVVGGSGSAPPREDEPAAPKSSLRILIVDDNRDAADSLAMMLRLLGNDIHTAHDGEEALTLAGEFRPDVVLLDIGLPKLTGYEACRRIREQPWGKQMVLLAVTGCGQEEDRRRSREAGFDKHMVKPVDPQALLNLLGELGEVKASARI